MRTVLFVLALLSLSFVARASRQASPHPLADPADWTEVGEVSETSFKVWLQHPSEFSETLRSVGSAAEQKGAAPEISVDAIKEYYKDHFRPRAANLANALLAWSGGKVNCSTAGPSFTQGEEPTHDVLICANVSTAFLSLKLNGAKFAVWRHKGDPSLVRSGTFSDIALEMFPLSEEIGFVTGLQMIKRKASRAPFAHSMRPGKTSAAKDGFGSSSSINFGSSSTAGTADFPAGTDTSPLIVDLTHHHATATYSLTVAMRCAAGTYDIATSSNSGSGPANPGCTLPSSVLFRVYSALPSTGNPTGSIAWSATIPIGTFISSGTALELGYQQPNSPFANTVLREYSLVDPTSGLPWTPTDYSEYWYSAQYIYTTPVSTSQERFWSNLANVAGSTTAGAMGQPIGDIPFPPVTPSLMYDLYSVNDRSTICAVDDATGLPVQSWRPKIAVIEFRTHYNSRPWNQTQLVKDTVQYASQVMGMSLAAASLSRLSVKGTEDVGVMPQGETELDVQMALAMCPSALIDVWAFTDSDTLNDDPFVSLLRRLAISGASATGDADVYSLSWSVTYSAAAMQTINNYLFLMSTQGLSFCTSAGDAGADFPQFPAEAPEAIAVGATAPLLRTGSAPTPAPTGSASSLTEIVCSAADNNLITSGGGFSNTFRTPSYQQISTVQSFIQTAASGYSGYRGYPDVAAIGAKLIVICNGSVSPTYGTSASSPIVAGLIARLNAIRTAAGVNKTIGGLHQLLYAIGKNQTTLSQLPVGEKAFMDVVQGSNCAGESGDPLFAFDYYPTSACFRATAGWDAVSGFGTLYYPSLAARATSFNFSYSPPVPTGAATNSTASSINTTYLVLIVVGGAIVLVLLLVGLIHFARRRSGNRSSGYQEDYISQGFLQGGGASSYRQPVQAIAVPMDYYHGQNYVQAIPVR